MISYSDQTFSIYSQFPAFTKSFWCIFFLFALFLVFLRPRNCSEHWVIFLFLSILFAKSRLSFNLLQGKEAKYIFLKKDSMFLLKPCVILSCLCQIFFFWLSRDFFPLLSVLISVFLCQYPWTLLFPGTFSDSPSGDPTKPLSSQCFSYPGMTVTLSTPPVSQRKEQKETGSRKSHYRSLGVFLIQIMDSLNIRSSNCGDHIYQMWYYNSTIVVPYIYYYYFY